MFSRQRGLRQLRPLALWTYLLAWVLLWACPGTSARAESTPLVRIGWTAWADAEAVTKIAKRVLERELSLEVQLVMADIEVQYQALATGDIDVMLMSWLPELQAEYLEQYGNRIINLGPIYTRARYGWAVPDYVPEDRLETVADLQRPDIADKLGRIVVGIEPSAGLMRSSKRALRAYGLSDMGYRLLDNSERSMTSALGRAIQNRQWIVVTAWNPHWKWARWDLRYLKDPKGIVSGQARIHALARSGFDTTAPRGVFDFFGRLFLPLDELQEVLHHARRTSSSEAVEAYIAAHPGRVRYWLTGEIDARADQP